MATITERIINYMRAEGEGTPLSPVEIATRLRVKRKTVTSILNRLAHQGRRGVLFHAPNGRIMRGFYCWVPENRKPVNPLEYIDREPKIHDVVIHIPKPYINIQGTTAIKDPWQLWDELKILYREGTFSEGKHTLKCNYDYFGRLIQFRIHPGKNSITIYIKASKTKYNMSFFEYFQLLETFRIGLLSNIWENSEIIQKKIEFNRDAMGVNIRDMRDISIQRAKKELLHIYNKGDNFRVEKQYYNDISAQNIAKELGRIERDGTQLTNNVKIGELTDKINLLHGEIKGLKSENQELKGNLSKLVDTLGDLITSQSFNNPTQNVGYG